MHLFIGSASGLPIIPWNPRSPGFHVVPLAREAEALRRKLHCPRVYYAGGHEGCGCSFNVARAYAGLTAPARDARLDLGGLMRSRRDLDDLGEYLRSHHVARLYHCWDGSEPEPIASRARASVEMIVSREFRLRDRELIEIVPATALIRPEPPLEPPLEPRRGPLAATATAIAAGVLPAAAPRPARLGRRRASRAYIREHLRVAARSRR